MYKSEKKIKQNMAKKKKKSYTFFLSYDEKMSLNVKII